MKLGGNNILIIYSGLRTEAESENHAFRGADIREQPRRV